MPKIVISYRRADSESIAGRIRDRLANRYGPDSIFMDIDSIPVGVDFRTYIAEALENTDILLAIIGRAWAGELERDARIHSPTDPIRIELEKAFELKITIFPVLVNGAAMPDPDKIPESLKPLPYLNAAFVDSGRDFHPHVDRLIRSTDRILGNPDNRDTWSGQKPEKEIAPSRDQTKKLPQSRWLLLAGYAAGAILLVLGLFLYGWILPRSRPVVNSVDRSSGATVIPVDCKEERNLRSLGTNVSTSIEFRNKGTKIIRIYWLDHSGKRVLYGTLGRDQIHSQQTFITHPWVITDTADQCKAIYMPAMQRLEIDVMI